ncbi:Ger(x)C family spore germination protein [Paenibacillus sp. PL2-23]|uniref:Ger(x)C family spore germination protein n=1 Tax=Paenibacillus sp. PL2-23 TaxID=2100729 RepID=UPI0030FBF616
MNHLLRRLFPAIAIWLIILPTLSGCWDNKDINHRALPIAMGIAKREGIYVVILQIPEPGLGATKIRIVQQTGTTINEIVDRMSKNMESQVDLLHLKVVLFEASFAEVGVHDIVETFMRAHALSPNTMAAICDEPIDTFFHNIEFYNKNNGTVLINFFEKNAGWNPHIAADRIWELYRSMRSYTRDTVVPIIRSGKGTVIESRGSAVIRNGRFVERLSSDETLLINVFNGISARGKIEVMDHATVQIIGTSIRRRSFIQNGRPILTVSVTLKGSLVETRGQPTIDQIKKEIDEQLTVRFEGMLRKLQKENADILGTGQLFRTKYNRVELSHWRTDYFPQLRIDIKFNSIIQNTGNLKAQAQ